MEPVTIHFRVYPRDPSHGTSFVREFSCRNESNGADVGFIASARLNEAAVQPPRQGRTKGGVNLTFDG